MNTDKTYFTKEDLEYILEGSVLLGSGGGGSKESGKSLIAAILNEGKNKRNMDRNMERNIVEYISPENVDDAAYMSVLAGVGAPEAMKESGFGYSAGRAFELLENEHRKSKQNVHDSSLNSFSYIVSGETGSIAMFVSMLVAVKKNIPAVDGDGAGRACPCLQMVTFYPKIPISPVVLVTSVPISDGGTEVVLHQNSPSAVDDVSRSIIESKEFNDIASIACYTMSGKDMKETIVRGTFTKARDLGEIITENIGINVSDFLEMLEEKTNIKGYLLFEGRVSNIENKTNGGFDFGKVTIEKNGEKVYVLHQNENLSAFLIKEDQKVKPLAFAPDLICYMELDEHKIKQSCSNVDIQKNTEVALIGFSADEKLLENFLLDLFTEARGNLGDFYEYKRIEDLNKPDKKLLDGILTEARKII